MSKLETTIITLADVYHNNWKHIGTLLNENPEKVRSIYRRCKSNEVDREQVKKVSKLEIHNRKRTERVVFITDQHYPFQDDYTRSIALQIVEEFNPTIVITGSDGIDFYAISDFDKNPERIKSTGLQLEIDSWIGGEREWISVSPNATRYYIEGNHEDRLRRYLYRHPEVADLRALQLENLLEFDSLGIEKSINNEVLIGNLMIKHGTRVNKSSAYSGASELASEHFQYSILTGHVHRMGTHFVTTRKGIVQAQECGCLCKLDVEYANRPNWQQGIVLATVSNESVDIEPILIHQLNENKRRAYWRGREYREQ